MDAQGNAAALLETALSSRDVRAVASAIKALTSLLPLDLDQEIAVDKRALALIAAGEAGNCPELAEAIALFVYERARHNSIFALPYIPALLSFLDYEISTTGAYAYYTLIIVARIRPDSLRPHIGTLIRMLDNPRDANKAFGAKIIAAIAREHPEQVVGALRALKRLSADSLQPIIQKAATEAYDAINDGLNHEGQGLPARGSVSPDVVARPSGNGKAPDDQPAGINGGGVKSLIAWLREKVRTLIGLKLYVSLRLVGLTGDADEMGVTLSQFSELAPWIKAECRPGREAAESRVPTLPMAGGIDDAAGDEAAMKRTRERFLNDICKTTTPNMAAIKVADPHAPAMVVEALDETQIAELQRMLADVQQDFTISADSVLSTIGLSHLKPGSNVPLEGGSLTISSKEFMRAVETIIKEQARQKTQGTTAAPAPAEVVDAQPSVPDTEKGPRDAAGIDQRPQDALSPSITRLFSALNPKKPATDEQ